MTKDGLEMDDVSVSNCSLRDDDQDISDGMEMDQKSWKWEQDDDTINETIHFQNNYIRDLDTSEGTMPFRLNDEEPIPVVSPGSTRGRPFPSCEFDDDAFLASIIALSPLDSPPRSHHMRSIGNNLDTRGRRSGIENDYNGGVEINMASAGGIDDESINLQYQQLMRRLASSMERTNATREFFKRIRIDLGRSFAVSSDNDESRKNLYRILRRDTEHMPAPI